MSPGSSLGSDLAADVLFFAKPVGSQRVLPAVFGKVRRIILPAELRLRWRKEISFAGLKKCFLKIIVFQRTKF